MVKPVIEGIANYILQQIRDTVEYGEHNLLIYPNLDAVRDLNSEITFFMTSE